MNGHRGDFVSLLKGTTHWTRITFTRSDNGSLYNPSSVQIEYHEASTTTPGAWQNMSNLSTGVYEFFKDTSALQVVAHIATIKAVYSGNTTLVQLTVDLTAPR